MEKKLKLSGKHARRIDLDARIERKRRASPEFRQAYDTARRRTEIARVLAELRQRRGLTQKELARRLKTSQQAISRLEHLDYTGHTLHMLERYVRVLGGRLEFRIVEDGGT